MRNPKQDQEERSISLYQRDQVQAQNKNQIGASRAGEPQGDQPNIGEGVVEAVRAAFDRGPGLAEARIHRAILESCPELARSWAPRYVAKLVALGEIPPEEVDEALRDFREQMTRIRQGVAPPIRKSESSLACHLLKKALARHGHPWRKQKVS